MSSLLVVIPVSSEGLVFLRKTEFEGERDGSYELPVSTRDADMTTHSQISNLLEVSFYDKFIGRMESEGTRVFVYCALVGSAPPDMKSFSWEELGSSVSELEITDTVTIGALGMFLLNSPKFLSGVKELS